MRNKHSFTRKEIALLLDMIEVVRILPADQRKVWGMTDEKLRQMYFKLYRIL